MKIAFILYTLNVNINLPSHKLDIFTITLYSKIANHMQWSLTAAYDDVPVVTQH